MAEQTQRATVGVLFRAWQRLPGQYWAVIATAETEREAFMRALTTPFPGTCRDLFVAASTVDPNVRRW